MSTNNTVQLNIATTNTAKATKDVKSLKEQIRDLKNEMAGLTKGTDEYDAAATQLGDLMHQQAEITEAAKLATNDYGQTLSNITSISAGVVGSISAMNGVLNLVGASSDEATEAIRKIQSLMAIVQGLNQIEAAEKAFNGLWTRIKLLTAAKKDDTQETIKNTTATNTNAVSTELDAKAKKKDAAASGVATAGNNVLSVSFKNLGRAIKSFMASNPFTLLILGVTSLIGLMGSLSEEVDEVDTKLSSLRVNRVEELNKEIEDLSGTVGNKVMRDEGKKLVDSLKSENWDKLIKEALEKNDKRYLSGVYKELGTRLKEAEAVVEQTQLKINKLIAEGKEDTEEYITTYDELLDKQLEMYKLKALEAEYLAASRAISFELRKQGRLALEKSELENITQEWVNEAKDSVENAYETVYKQTEAIRKNNQANDQKSKDDQAKRIKERQARELSDLKAQYALQELETNKLYKNQELTEQEYYERSIKELESYLEQLRQLKIKHNKENSVLGELDAESNPTYLTKEDLVEIGKNNAQAVELERKRVESIIELEKKLADAKNYNYPRASVDETRYNSERNRLTDEQGGRYMEQQDELFNAWWLKKFTLIEKYNQREVEEEREHNDQLNRLAMEHYAEEKDVLDRNLAGDEEYEKAKFDNEMKYLQEKLDAKLISQQDYNLAAEQLEREHQERMDELQNEHNSSVQELEANRIETLRDIAQQRYEIEKDYYDRRLELDQAYITAYQSLTSAIGGILSEAQQKYEEGSKQYEQIQEASIIMDTISGSLAAFMSGVKSGIPAPYNFILAGVLSAAALVEGQLALNNLHSKKLSAGASNAPSVSAYQVVAQETNAELSGQIQDQRVYVTETDIADTMARVNVIEAESTF